MSYNETYQTIDARDSNFKRKKAIAAIAIIGSILLLVILGGLAFNSSQTGSADIPLITAESEPYKTFVSERVVQTPKVYEVLTDESAQPAARTIVKEEYESESSRLAQIRANLESKYDGNTESTVQQAVTSRVIGTPRSNAEPTKVNSDNGAESNLFSYVTPKAKPEAPKQQVAKVRPKESNSSDVFAVVKPEKPVKEISKVIETATEPSGIAKQFASTNFRFTKPNAPRVKQALASNNSDNSRISIYEPAREASIKTPSNDGFVKKSSTPFDPFAKFGSATVSGSVRDAGGSVQLASNNYSNDEVTSDASQIVYNNNSVNSTSSDKDYFIQLGSFRSTDNLRTTWNILKRRFPSQLRRLNYNVQTANFGERGTFYRLQAGSLPNQIAGKEVCAILMANGQDCIVVWN